ncbi:hypothetical protein D3C81_1692910 [compost metagenome]
MYAQTLKLRPAVGPQATSWSGDSLIQYCPRETHLWQFNPHPSISITVPIPHPSFTTAAANPGAHEEKTLIDQWTTKRHFGLIIQKVSAGKAQRTIL